MKELKVNATIENMDQVIALVERCLEEQGCPMQTKLQVAIAVEEIYVNIAHYAYGDGVGPVTIQVEMGKDPLEVQVTFIDGGKPYDPLAREDPDVTLSAEERQIGGLGIFMVKQSMDQVTYQYREGKNILTIRKAFQRAE